MNTAPAPSPARRSGAAQWALLPRFAAAVGEIALRVAGAISALTISAAFNGAYAQFDSQSASAAASAVSTAHVRAELLAHAPQGLAPGQPLWLGLQLTHQPLWHSYWKNPGDSGLPTELVWSLPAGLDAGEIAWPVPERIALEPLVNYGYQGQVLLAVPVTVGAGFAPGPGQRDAVIRLRASWLVCRKECIPEQGELSLRLPIRASTAIHGAAFAKALARAPQALHAAGAQARVDGSGQLQISVPGLPAALRGKALELFPETPEILANGARPQQAWNGSLWTARLPLAPERSQSPTRLAVVLAEPGGAAGSARSGYRAELDVTGAWPAPAAAPGVPAPLAAALAANSGPGAGGANPAQTGAAAPGAAPLTLGAALLGALLGGLILNLMPCVFPVLALKIAGFARHRQHSRGTQRMTGLAYTAGALLGCTALGAALLALRAAGQAVGWGFQLQSPAVVAALAALFTLIALNLAGLFEVGNLLPSALASLQLRHPVADAGLTGLLAVAVATPCTAPFMGASLGLAATLPAPLALALFAALGLGLALPYLAASLAPALARALPRPGAWMLVLRRWLAFPMLATVVWLVWVLGQQSGIDGAAALLALLLGLCMLVWALALTGRARRWLGAGSAALLALLLWAFAPYIGGAAAPESRAAPMAGRAAPPASSGATGTAGAPASPGRWQRWAPGAAEQLAAGGQPVFVDFTAAWCVTCQYNKKTTLDDPALLAELAAKNVALLRADWTRRDSAISTALTALGRSGVPVYLLYRPGKPVRAPLLLGEILSVSELRAAISEL